MVAAAAKVAFVSCGVPRIDAYVRDVLSGKVTVGRLIRLAIQRHLGDLVRAKKGWDFYFDVREAAFALTFVEQLRHSKGEWAGKRITLSSWQVWLVGTLFGWRRRDSKIRRFRTAYVEVGRKNGKSTLGAALGHKLFVGDGEQGAEVYTAATKLQQARIVHEESKRMRAKSPGLRRITGVNRDAIFCEATGSTYRPMGSGAERETEDGLNVHGAIVDELHAHRTRETWDVLETATGARKQPLLIAITTAGDGNKRQTICWELRTYSVKVLEGRHDDPTWFAAIYALDEARYDERGLEIAPADDWTNEENWSKANPNLGVSQKIDDLRVKCAKAVETPTAAPNFRRKHLNEWISIYASWLAAGLWRANAGPEVRYGPAGLLPAIRDRYRGQPCWVGGDLSSVNDLTALVFAFKRVDGGLDLFPFAWCPQATAIEKSRNRNAPYMVWADCGQLFITQGDSVDYDSLRALLREARDVWGWDIQVIGLDPHNARYPATCLIEQDRFKVQEFQQGFKSMNDPTKQTMRLLLKRQIHHGGHQPLAWCVDNVVVRTDPAGNIKLDKEKSPDKIDLAVASVMAAGLALDSKAVPTFKKTNGLRML